jgi:putative phosphoribosyl transferase
MAAVALPHEIWAVVSCGGRPDLAGRSLLYVQAPTLLIVGSRDLEVIERNEQAQARMRCEASLAMIPGASHLFEDPGALELVAARAGTWFATHLGGDTSRC